MLLSEFRLFRSLLFQVLAGACIGKYLFLEAPRWALHFGETEAAANRGGKLNVTRIESFGFAYPLRLEQDGLL